MYTAYFSLCTQLNTIIEFQVAVRRREKRVYQTFEINLIINVCHLDGGFHWLKYILLTNVVRAPFNTLHHGVHCTTALIILKIYCIEVFYLFYPINITMALNTPLCYKRCDKLG